jgi:hypothetical protein
VNDGIRITSRQIEAFQRFANDTRLKNELAIRRWRKERRALRESGLRNLTVVVRP